METKKIRVKLVFHDWVRLGNSIYNTEEGLELSSGDFHSGTTFKGEIELDEWNAFDLVEAFKKNAWPAFYLIPAEDAK
jgi:hypothetical protein